MVYRKADEILPMEIIKLIQKYVDGENIYIPRKENHRKENHRKEWGSGTFIRQELKDRNHQIFTDYNKGNKVQDLAIKYFISEKSIQRIIRNMN